MTKGNQGDTNWKGRSQGIIIRKCYGIHQNPKNSNREFLQLINIVSEVAGYKSNSQKSAALLYTNNKWTEKNQTTPFTIVSQYKISQCNSIQASERPI